MHQPNRIVASIFLLILLLTPSLVKFGHHHEFDCCSCEKEAILQSYQEECQVCAFEFSVFTEAVGNPLPNPINFNYFASVPVIISLPGETTAFSFHLRAPPVTVCRS